MGKLDQCDICGRYPAQTVTVVIGDKTLEKDLCGSHLSEALQGARALPPPGSVASAQISPGVRPHQAMRMP